MPLPPSRASNSSVVLSSCSQRSASRSLAGLIIFATTSATARWLSRALAPSSAAAPWKPSSSKALQANPLAAYRTGVLLVQRVKINSALLSCRAVSACLPGWNPRACSLRTRSSAAAIMSAAGENRGLWPSRSCSARSGPVSSFPLVPDNRFRDLIGFSAEPCHRYVRNVPGGSCNLAVAGGMSLVVLMYITAGCVACHSSLTGVQGEMQEEMPILEYLALQMGPDSN